MPTVFPMLIDGEAVGSAETIAVINPADESLIAHAPDCDRDHLDQAVAAARRAQGAWAGLSFADRRASLHAIADIVIENVDTLQCLLTLEQGKPHAEARGEILAAVQHLRDTLTLDLPVLVAEDNQDRYVETRYLPLGVVAAIAPWNFPIMLAISKIGPALLTGNTVVLKPSPLTPLSTLRIGELVRDLLPPGVFNIVSGGDRLGPWLVEHAGVDKISFTGSTRTGRKIMQSAAPTLKRLTLELGGNDAAIVMADVDVAALVPRLFWMAFGNCGQVCVAIKRLYVHKDIYEEFKEAFVAYARSIKMGNGSDQGTEIGPLVSKDQYDRVIGLIEDSQVQGHSFLTGNGVPPGLGYFVPITIIDNPPTSARIVREEQFGPVLPLIRFDDISDIVACANDSEYGLGGSIWTGDEAKALEMAAQLQAGTVWINGPQYTSALAPFGGHKQSGLGVEGGMDGLLHYTVARTIVIHRNPMRNELSHKA